MERAERELRIIVRVNNSRSFLQFCSAEQTAKDIFKIRMYTLFFLHTV